jgi:hypothetical protein
MSVYSHREISPKLSIKLGFMSRKIAKEVENRGARPGGNACFASILAFNPEIPLEKTFLQGKVLVDLAGCSIGRSLI